MRTKTADRRPVAAALALAAGTASVPACLLAQDLAAGAGDTTLTIYSTARPGAIAPEQYRPTPGHSLQEPASVPGYAMVRRLHDVDLRSGTNRIELRDVAAYIDPTTVTFESLTAPDSTRVVEQSFQFDLVSTEKLMERYVGRTITVDQPAGDAVTAVTGTLLSTRGGVVIQSDDGEIHALGDYRNVRFPALPGGLITEPTLLWQIEAEQAGTHEARVGYQTSGLTWWADYNLVFAEGADANSGSVDVGAWVSILNRSGTSFDDARLKLIAGDVNRVEPSRLAARALESAVAQDAAGFDEQAFFEFHLYTLGRRTSLSAESTKQIELFSPVRDVPARRLLVYQGAAPGFRGAGSPVTDRDFGLDTNTKVDVYLELENSEDAGLGMPLPSGRVRVSQLDETDDSLEFIGEDVIDHTPRDETVRLALGSAFDVVGERRQVALEVNRDAGQMQETIEVTLRNHKDLPVEVIVREVLYRWSGNEIRDASHDYEREDARTVHFPVEVPADGETTVRYTVDYRW